VPDGTHRIASPTDTSWADPGTAGGWYKLTAVDVNGNESPAALVSPAGTTGAGALPPAVFALERVRPNPARATALTVEFGLADDAPARLEVLDVAGRVVLARTVAGAGSHALSLSPERRMAPGLYLVRLRQGERSLVQRVAVIE